MKTLIEMAPNTLVDPFTVTAVQARLGGQDPYKGSIVITTIGGNVYVTSENIPVDLEKISKLITTASAPVATDTFGNIVPVNGFTSITVVESTDTSGK